MFTGNDDDPDTLENLTAMGSSVRAMCRPLFAAGTRARAADQIVSARVKFSPAYAVIAGALARATDPDEAIIRLTSFWRGFRRGAIFSLLQSNDNALKLLVDIVGVAPRLSAWLSRNAQLVDILIETRPTNDGDDFEVDNAGFCRYFGCLAPRCASQPVPHRRFPACQSDKFSNCGHTICRYCAAQHFAAIAAAQRDIAARHGSLEQAEMAVIGMGKLGSGEMSLQSDLDLVIVCDSSDFAETSDGDKPLAGDVWMARRARLISGLTVPTQEGSLYNVDMRCGHRAMPGRWSQNDELYGLSAK